MYKMNLKHYYSFHSDLQIESNVFLDPTKPEPLSFNAIPKEQEIHA
jgi:hypothetical protein